MLTSQLLLSLRYKLGENDYSVYQIIDALNYVMKEINLALSSVTSSLIIKSATLTLTDNEADLPSDLESIISVPGKINIPFTDELDSITYQVVGDKIRAEGDTLDIYYRKSFPQYELDGTEITPATIDIPASFDNMIKDNIIALLTGQQANVQAQTIKLIANRDGKKRPQRLIFNL